ACSERMAASRPAPGPLTHTSTSRMPWSCAARAAASAAWLAAKGVPLREPLKPTVPADAQEMTLPCLSVMVTIVLLNVELICAIPLSTFLRSRRRGLALVLAFAKQIAPLLRLRLLLLPGYRAARPFPRARIGARPLAAHGQAAAVAQATIAADVDEALDVALHLAAQVAFHHEVLRDVLAQAVHLILEQISHARVGIHARRFHDLFGARAADPVNVRERHHDPLVAGQVDAGNSRHRPSPPTLASACASGFRK